MKRWLTALLVTAISVPAWSESPEATPPPLKTLNDHFPFQVPETSQQWHRRRESLRRRVLVATGLWPMPEKSQLDPKIYGKTDREGFTVEKVHFESLPGHYVSGLLFRPSADNPLGIIDGKRPAVLSPHGHGGRTMRLDDKKLKQQIESGGEVFERSGRYPKLARCAHLARMGCVSFIFDMLGYADSQQISYKVAHRHAEPRAEESDSDAPCFYSIHADLNLQSIMGLQTWNAIRSLDFLAELPDVDSERLAVTGGSGGGTQTILLGAIDDRVKVSFPNGMVSTAMQGGCYCENCNYLRIGTGNVELAALFAPKPQGMTAADDWTRDMMSDGYPELQKLYGMLGAADNVMCRPLLQFPHNYNYVTRATMYSWMAEHLSLSEETPLHESDFTPLSEAEMMVWDETHPAPDETGVEHERNVLRWWKQQNDRAISKTIDSQDDQRFREVVGGAWKVIFDREPPTKRDVTLTSVNSVNSVNSEAEHQQYRVHHPKWKTDVKVVEAIAKAPQTEFERTLLFVGPSDEFSQTDRLVQLAFHGALTWKDSATQVLMVQPSPPEGVAKGKQRLIDDKRSYSGFTFGYNRPLAVKRYEQILCVIAALGSTERPIHLISMGDDSISAAAVAALHPSLVDSYIVQPSSEGTASDYADASFLPGSEKYLGLPGLLALRAPNALTIYTGAPDRFSVTETMYSNDSNLTLQPVQTR